MVASVVGTVLVVGVVVGVVSPMIQMCNNYRYVC
jgi:hypothetical protein